MAVTVMSMGLLMSKSVTTDTVTGIMGMNTDTLTVEVGVSEAVTGIGTTSRFKMWTA
jgi:hypothetical protein